MSDSDGTKGRQSPGPHLIPRVSAGAQSIATTIIYLYIMECRRLFRTIENYKVSTVIGDELEVGGEAYGPWTTPLAIASCLSPRWPGGHRHLRQHQSHGISTTYCQPVWTLAFRIEENRFDTHNRPWTRSSVGPDAEGLLTARYPLVLLGGRYYPPVKANQDYVHRVCGPRHPQAFVGDDSLAADSSTWHSPSSLQF